MEQCGNLIRRLNKILENLKKNPSRKYRFITLKKKLNESKEIYNELLHLIEQVDINEQILLLKATRNIYGEIKIFLDTKLNFPKLISFKTIALLVLNSIKCYNKVKMAAIEIIRTIPALIPLFSGEGEKLNSIVAALNACKVLITDANRAVALQVILSRLEGKARSAVGDNPADIDEIITKLKDKCKVTIAPETVVAKLNATKQNGEIGKFTEQIEKLTLELERAYISEDVPVATASRMAVKAGVKALAGGVKNNETRILLKAGQFTTLSSAVEKLTENESTNNTSSVMSYRTHRGNFNNNSRFSQQNRGNGQYQNRQNNRYTPRGYNHSNNYRGNNRGHYNNRGNPRGGYNNNNGRNYQNNQNRAGQGHNVYYAQSENCPAPQPVVVGGNNAGAHQHQNQQHAPQHSNQQQNVHQCATFNRR